MPLTCTGYVVDYSDYDGRWQMAGVPLTCTGCVVNYSGDDGRWDVGGGSCAPKLYSLCGGLLW